MFSGKFYWIPEATHHSSKFEVKNGAFVKPGTELTPNVYSKIQGLAHINELDQELIVKPVELVCINNLKNGSEDEG